MTDNQILNYLPIDKWSVPFWVRQPKGKLIGIKYISTRGLGLATKNLCQAFGHYFDSSECSCLCGKVNRGSN